MKDNTRVLVGLHSFRSPQGRVYPVSPSCQGLLVLRGSRLLVTWASVHHHGFFSDSDCPASFWKAIVITLDHHDHPGSPLHKPGKLHILVRISKSKGMEFPHTCLATESTCELQSWDAVRHAGGQGHSHTTDVDGSVSSPQLQSTPVFH